MHKQIHLLTICILFSCCCFAQNSISKVDTDFKSLLRHPSLQNGIASLHIVDTETGKAVYQSNAQTGLPTASTLKVITAITALDLLGTDYTYKTNLVYSGSIDSLGILHGDLYIQGSGDPTLGSDRYPNTAEKIILEQWKIAISASGIKAIQGRIVGDDRLYHGHDVPDGWIWTDIGNYYGAGVSALNWRENKSGIDFQSGNVGIPAQIVQTSSDFSYLTTVNQVTIGNKGTGDNVNAYSAPYSNKIYLKGTYGQDLKKTIEISIPDPAFDLAYQLHKYLEKNNILISSPPTTAQHLNEMGESISKNYTHLYTHTSPKLEEIVYWFNQKSINLYGEALLRSIAFFSGGKTTTQDGTHYVKEYWKQRLGISSSELKIRDGSGLSPQNNVTSEAMNKIMQYAVQRTWYPSFVKSLPTINQMTMKSGTIGGTLGYTGYHKAKTGQAYTFTLLVYNYQGTATAMRQQMFNILNNLK